MPRNLMRLIEQADALTVHLQPIFRETPAGLSCEMVEALVRGPAGTHLADPSVLFEYARRKQEEVAVDRLCVAAITRQAALLPEEVCVAINVHASTLAQDPKFPAFVAHTLDHYEISPSRLVVEVIEHSPTWFAGALRGILDELRELGIRIALDDFGVGSSNLALLLECRPEVLKLDRSFITGCDQRPEHRLVIKTSLELAHGLGAELVAEGIETEPELAVLGRLGVSLYQGHLLARPLPPEAIRRFLTEAPPARGTKPCGNYHEASKGHP